MDGAALGASSGGLSVRTDSSFIRLIYAFALEPGETHGCERTQAAAVLSRLKQRAPGCGWKDRSILYDYVLPHLADHVNARDPRNGEAEVGHWWRFAEQLPTRWTLRVDAGRRVELELNGVDLLFFRTGVGMLLLEIDPLSDRLEDWQDVLHLTRFYRLPAPDPASAGARGVFARRAADLTAAVAADEADRSGWQPSASGRPCGFGSVIQHLLTELFGDRTWERASVPGLLTPFSAFFVDGYGADERLGFEAVYRWRRQLRSSASVVAAGHADLHAELRDYAEHVWLAYSSEGGGLFAADTPRVHFFDHDLPDHLRRPYIFGYLLALHQRLALGRFSERIARVVAASRGRWTSDQPPRDEIALLQDDFLEYLTRCHFAQVFRTTNHHTNYRTWEEVLEVRAFAGEVELQLRHLYERSVIADRIIDEKRRTRLSGRVNAAVLGIALPTVVLAILAVAYPSGLRLATTVALAVGSVVLGTVTGWLTATARSAGDVPDQGSSMRRSAGGSGGTTTAPHEAHRRADRARLPTTTASPRRRRRKTS